MEQMGFIPERSLSNKLIAFVLFVGVFTMMITSIATKLTN